MKINLFILLFFVVHCIYSQEEKNNHFALQLDYFYGNVIKHKKKISHLAISHPEGFMLSWNNKTTSKDKNLMRYNYPDYGYTFIYHDYKNPILGKSYSLQANYTFYFGSRIKKNQFYLKLGQGIAYNTSPFDLENNNKNIAFGSHLLTTTTIGFNYKRKRIFKALDANIGILLSHYSNGLIKSPNIGLNLLSLNTGISYNLDEQNPIDYSVTYQKDTASTMEPVKMNLQFSGGINSSSNIEGKQFPFYVGTVYADKRINQKSILQFGSEIFFSNFLKEEIRFNSVAFPERPFEDGKADYKRVSLFLGHELDVDKFSIITQLGYYIYYPYPYETRYYERIGVKKYFGDQWFATATIKAHLFLAESIDLGIGIRL